MKKSDTLAETKQLQQKIKRQRILLGVVSIGMLAVLALGAAAYINRDAWFGSPSTVLAVDENAVDYTGAQPQKPSGSQIAMPGYPSITLPAGEKAVELALLNPEGNACYFTFELFLMEDGEAGESLYQSKLVPPGKAVRRATLKHTLKAESYPARILVTTNALDTLAPMTSANIETTLIVK